MTLCRRIPSDSKNQAVSAIPRAFQLAPDPLAATAGIKSSGVLDGQMALYGIAGTSLRVTEFMLRMATTAVFESLMEALTHL
jgi:hypothetical protein